MGKASKIEWTHHTFNPWRGCQKVSPGCAHCYADAQAKRNPKVLGIWGEDGTRVIAKESYWQQPLAWDRWAAQGVCWNCGGKSIRCDTPGRCVVCDGTGNISPYRARVFCASMADVFEDRADLVGPRARLFALIDQTPSLDWLLLTKRPENILGMLPNPRIGDRTICRPNVWLGASCEDQARADERILRLLGCPAVVHFLSLEPLLGPIVLPEEFLLPSFASDDPRHSERWAIVGGESGPRARPMHPDWARGLRDQCQAAGVAFHFKQWGEWVEKQYVAIATNPEIDGRRLICLTPPRGEMMLPDARDYGDAVHPVNMVRVGKRAAGRVLDGRTWDEYPRLPADLGTAGEGAGESRSGEVAHGH